MLGTPIGVPFKIKSRMCTVNPRFETGLSLLRCHAHMTVRGHGLCPRHLSFPYTSEMFDPCVVKTIVIFSAFLHTYNTLLILLNSTFAWKVPPLQCPSV